MGKYATITMEHLEMKTFLVCNMSSNMKTMENFCLFYTKIYILLKNNKIFIEYKNIFIEFKI